MEALEIVKNIFVVLHFVGLASLLGGFLLQMRAMRTASAKIVPAMVHGAWTMLITGLVLVGLHEMMDHEVNNLKVGAKLIVVLVITVLVMINRKKENVKTAVFGAIGALTLLNVILAVFW